MANSQTTRRWLATGAGLAVVAAITAGALNLINREKPADVPLDTRTTTASDVGSAYDGSSVPVTQGKKPLFDQMPAASTGVHFVHRILTEHPQAYLYNSGYQCGGVCLGDVNADGLCDIFLVSGPDDNALFLNQGNFKFKKSSSSDILAGSGTWGVAAGMFDVEGDGDLDIYVCNYNAPNRLWLNDGVDDQGEPRFNECAAQSGLAFAGPSLCPYFADFDGDGDLDLFLLTNRMYAPFGRPSEVASELGPDGQPRLKEQYAGYFRVVRPSMEVPGHGQSEPGPFMLEYGHEDRLYRNDGAGDGGVPSFKDVTGGSGIDGVAGHGLSALIWDVNHDGRQDIYVANDFTDLDRLWINEGASGDGGFRFRDVTDEFLPYTTWSSMGSDVADINGDGRLDFFVADMAGTTHFKAKSTMGEMNGWRRWVLENGWPRQAMRNMLFVDSGVGRYLETGYLSGVARSDWTWAARFADFDLDCKNDLFLTNGSSRVFNDSDIIVDPTTLVGRTEWDVFRDAPEMREKNLAFRNVGGLHFEDVSRQWNLDQEGMSFAAASGDLDGDGDLDLVVCNLNEDVLIYRNRAADDGGHWIKVRLDGDDRNRHGWGAVVTAKLENGASLVRLMNPQTGFLSGSEPVLHFGLGAADKIASLEVRWPGGKVQKLGPQSADQLLEVSEALADTPFEPVPGETPRFVELAQEIGLDFQHQDRPYNDYLREFLLPGKLSQFGPGLAVADVNSDGLDDVFVGGAAGQAGALYVHLPNHGFARVVGAPWEADAEQEDMGALFLDADRDGDLDLYVAHGSNEWHAGDPTYADKLYLNESAAGGPPRFAAAPDDALPALYNSGSCVVGADYDHDGDVDLFVGSRSIPGQYPLVPESTLLRNDGERPGDVKFTDATSTVAPELARAGLVTAALWTDVDGDGWTDLLVACEWGPVRLFANQEGRLVEMTDEALLGERSGWWNSITGADFDGDGDIDYAALNVGLNTKYGHASVNKPAILYRGDMDANGRFDLVEAKSSADGELPVRGRSCSSNAMPVLRDRFPTYKEFAAANLVTIYGDQCLNTSDKVVATEFESGMWINESQPGRPRFSWRALPVEAQLSPCFGAAAVDFSGDGPSLAIAQNLYSREPETGLWRGGLGCILDPDKTAGGWRHVSLRRTGFVVAGDGKGLAVVDLDADGQPDLLVTQNNDAMLAFQQTTTGDVRRKPVAVRLIGAPGNPLGFGALVRLVGDGELLATTEIYGGSGYLSQSTSTAYFARPSEVKSLEVQVQWPHGAASQVTVESGQSEIVVASP